MRRVLLLGIAILFAGCAAPTPEQRESMEELYKDRIVVIEYQNGVLCYLHTSTGHLSCVQ